MQTNHNIMNLHSCSSSHCLTKDKSIFEYGRSA